MAKRRRYPPNPNLIKARVVIVGQEKKWSEGFYLPIDRGDSVNEAKFLEVIAQRRKKLGVPSVVAFLSKWEAIIDVSARAVSLITQHLERKLRRDADKRYADFKELMFGRDDD